MCVAEALLRIPDADTADRLIRDKLGDADWDRHLGASDSLFVNASTWGLMLTGKIISLAEETRRNFLGALKRLVARTGEPVVRLAVAQRLPRLQQLPWYRRGDRRARPSAFAAC